MAVHSDLVAAFDSLHGHKNDVLAHEACCTPMQTGILKPCTVVGTMLTQHQRSLSGGQQSSLAGAHRQRDLLHLCCFSRTLDAVTCASQQRVPFNFHQRAVGHFVICTVWLELRCACPSDSGLACGARAMCIAQLKVRRMRGLRSRAPCISM